MLWGAFAFVDGVTALSGAIADPLLRHRGWAAFWGVTGIAAGVLTFAWPSITAQALLIVIATWSLLIGGSQIVFAVRTRKQVSDAWAIALPRTPRRRPRGPTAWERASAVSGVVGECPANPYRNSTWARPTATIVKV